MLGVVSDDEIRKHTGDNLNATVQKFCCIHGVFYLISPNGTYIGIFKDNFYARKIIQLPRRKGQQYRLQNYPITWTQKTSLKTGQLKFSKKRDAKIIPFSSKQVTKYFFETHEIAKMY